MQFLPDTKLYSSCASPSRGGPVDTPLNFNRFYSFTIYFYWGETDGAQRYRLSRAGS